MKKIILLIGLISLLVCSVSAYPAHNYDTYVSDLDTTPTAADAEIDQEAIGYTGYSSTNCLASYAYTHFPNDAIFFFNGHGITYTDNVKGGGIQFGGDSVIIAKSYNGNPINKAKYCITDYSYNELDNVLLAVYLACYSAVESQYHESLVRHTVEKGADTCIGFQGSIIESKSCRWSEQFWEYLKNGETIADAADDAKNDCYWQYPFGYHGIDAYILGVETAGNSNNYLIPARYGV